METRVGVQVDRGHETCTSCGDIRGEKWRPEGVPLETHMTVRGACGSNTYAALGFSVTRHAPQLLLTHPSVINDRSSVNCITNSSSSIVHVSLVECCLGINNVVTTYLPFWSFPNNSPQVSRFRDVLRAAIERKRGRQSRGRETVLSSGTRSSFARSRIMRADSWEAVRKRSLST